MAQKKKAAKAAAQPVKASGGSKAAAASKVPAKQPAKSTAGKPAKKATKKAGGAPAFTGDCTLAIHVKDRQASAAWFTRMLGCKLLYDVAEIGWCELASPVAKLNIGLNDQGKPKKPGVGPVATWGVADIDAERARLEAAGVAFQGETNTIPGMVRLAVFTDPDGYSHMLFQSLQGH